MARIGFWWSEEDDDDEPDMRPASVGSVSQLTDTPSDGKSFTAEFELGDKVSIDSDDGPNGIVTAVVFRADAPYYEVTWFVRDREHLMTLPGWRLGKVKD